MDTYSFNVIWSNEDECFVATCPEFPGLSAFGDTRSEALEEAQVALELFIEQYEEDGELLPEPRRVQEYSGQTRLRMPTWLHRRLAEEADHQGTSFNQLAVSYLAAGVGCENAFVHQRRQIREMMHALMRGGFERGLSFATHQKSRSEEDYQYQDPLLRRIEDEAARPNTGDETVES